MDFSPGCPGLSEYFRYSRRPGAASEPAPQSVAALSQGPPASRPIHCFILINAVVLNVPKTRLEFNLFLAGL